MKKLIAVKPKIIVDVGKLGTVDLVICLSKEQEYSSEKEDAKTGINFEFYDYFEVDSELLKITRKLSSSDLDNDDQYYILESDVKTSDNKLLIGNKDLKLGGI